MDWTSYLATNETLINIICNIFTSIGTVGAVIVSLYFSYQSNNPKPKIKINAKAIIKQDFNASNNRYEDTGFIVIEVINLGFVPVEINCFFWSTGLFRKKHCYQIPSAFDQSISFPIHQTLSYHQDASYYINLAEFLKGAKNNLTKSKYHIINWIRTKLYYISVKSNVGNIYQSRIHKSLSKEILKVL